MMPPAVPATLAARRRRRPQAVTQSRGKGSRSAAQPAPLFLPLFKPGASLRPHSSHHSPLEGEPIRPLRLPWTVGRWRRFSCSPHRRDLGLAPSSCRLPLKGG
ncbi:MAG: hypothetical protein OXU61_06175, partial [Gammaproteobacteria bacterium]|nr:hypothetical protein [Gammaproteobacteria bacterium]